MSEMETFIGRFEEAEDQSIVPVDEDEFYEMEEAHGCHYVRVNGKIFKFWSIVDVDSYGFSATLPIQDGPIVICHWYNGGAEVHEVVGLAIKRYLAK